VNAGRARRKRSRFGDGDEGFELANLHRLYFITDSYRIDKIF
jgi:hypothetical protein